MKNVTYDLIKSFRPCYDPIRHIPADYNKSLIDFLNEDKIPFEDKLWLSIRTDFVSERLMRLFAVWCFRSTLDWIKNPDPASIEAANVAERFANNEATQEELDAAQYAAQSAAQSAWSAAQSAWSAAESSTYAAESATYAAQSAAWYAAQSAAQSAAWSAAESATYAAESAAQSAAWSAAESATYAAESAARSAYKIRCLDKLIEMIKDE